MRTGGLHFRFWFDYNYYQVFLVISNIDFYSSSEFWPYLLYMYIFLYDMICKNKKTKIEILFSVFVQIELFSTLTVATTLCLVCLFLTSVTHSNLTPALATAASNLWDSWRVTCYHTNITPTRVHCSKAEGDGLT